VSTIRGAASAAPSLIELADGIRADLAGIVDDNRASLRKAISAGEKLNQAKAQLGHGEWLPWLRESFTLSHDTARNYMRIANYEHARNLNSIREALAALPKKQRRKKSGTAHGSTQSGVGADLDVIAWVERQRAEGMTREKIVATSRQPGYPGDKPLSNGSVGTILAILHDREIYGREASPPKKKGPTWGGKRRRKLYEDNRRDGPTQLREMQIKIAEAATNLEHYDLPRDIGLSEYEQWDIADLFNDLTNLSQWLARALAITIAAMDDLNRQRTIQKLRDRATHPSVDQAERENALAAIERLQAAQRAKGLKA